MSKRPSFQFYPPDWRRDPGLRLCSMGARGLWIEMMCVMHDADLYGHLIVFGRAIEPAELARLVGESAPAVKKWLGELRANAVFSETPEGVIYSRRMVRDEVVRQARAAGGEAGAEHGHKGASHGAKGGRPRKEKTPVTDDDKGGFKPAPSSSSSSSPSGSSEPIGSDGKPPDPEKVMFDAGLVLLAKAGITERAARPMLGKWKRDHGAEAVITALGKAQREGAIDPKSFIEGALRNGQRPRSFADRPSAWSGGNLPAGAEPYYLDEGASPGAGGAGAAARAVVRA